MTDHIHTYEADDGSRLIVSSTRLRAWEHPLAVAVVPTPSGEDAVALAQAILAAAGDTGHRVVSDEDAHEGRLAAMRFSAEAMRERADEAIVAEEQRAQSALAAGEQTLTLPHLNGRLSGLRRARDVVTALPLLADADDTPVYESPQELVDEITRLRGDRDDTECVLIRKVEALESEVRELHAAMEHLGGRVEYLGAQMSSAQAAIRGVGSSLEEHAEAHLAYAADVERRLERLEQQNRPIVLHTPDSDH